MYGSLVLPCPHYLLPHCLLHCQSVKGLNSHQVTCSDRFPEIFGVLRVEAREKSFCLLDLSLETTLLALDCWKSLGSFETFAFFKEVVAFTY